MCVHRCLSAVCACLAKCVCVWGGGGGTDIETGTDKRSAVITTGQLPMKLAKTLVTLKEQCFFRPQLL